MRSRLVLLLAAITLLPLVTNGAVAEERLRVIIETDAGGDPDDEQSLVRFLLYVNEWDVEGIIANRERARDGENRNKQRTGLGVVRQLVNAYGACWTNLVQHDARYPKAELLLARTVSGADDTDDAVNLLIAAVDKPDPRPIWYSDWGTDHGAATNNLRRALNRVWRERGADGYAKFKRKLHIISGDLYAEHTAREPHWSFWLDTWRPPMNGKRWYHRFSAITARAGGFNLQRDVLTGHGPLGALYPTNTTHWQKEGDTPSFLNLIPTGMNEPGEPTWGSWAGRYGVREDAGAKRYFWANQFDGWRGTTNRDNTLARWAADLQNDFRARLDWCVKPVSAANHPPRVSLNGDTGTKVLRLRARAGTTAILDANDTVDPDRQSLRFEWIHYPEPGIYRGAVNISGGSNATASVQLPTDARGKTIHVLVTVQDSGAPPLSRYRRAVIEVE
jgi:hypothetical protein